MQIIGIAGLAQCGKSTLAKDIARVAYELKMRPIMMSFAGALKSAAGEVGASKTENPELYRLFCQEVGSKFRDPAYVPGVTGPDYWVNLTRRSIAKLADSGAASEIAIIFDDVRFLNEVQTIKSMGGVMIYVDRETELPDVNADFRKHESERLAYELKADGNLRQSLMDYTVCSTGSMDLYLTRVAPFIPVWLGRALLGIPKEG